MPAPVLLDLKDGIALVTMDDGKANAINPSFIAAYHEALDDAERRARVLIITGRTGRFCAGLDLKTLPSLPHDALLDFRRRFASWAARIFTFPLPVVMACNGHAIAGGAILLLCGDFRVGAAGPFKIGLNEVAIGLPLPSFAIEIVRAGIDAHHHAHVMLEAALHDPQTARELGFLDEVVAPEALREAALARAQALTALNATAYAETKRRLRQPGMDAALALAEDEIARFFAVPER